MLGTTTYCERSSWRCEKVRSETITLEIKTKLQRILLIIWLLLRVSLVIEYIKKLIESKILKMSGPLLHQKVKIVKFSKELQHAFTDN